MSFELLREKKPSGSTLGMMVTNFLALMLLGTAGAFAWMLLTGRGNSYLLGTLLAVELLLAGGAILCYARSFVGFREVAEDREEELLW